MDSNLKKILIIDDEPVICNTLKALLESYDYQVITAFNGAEGIECFTAESPDMIISDINMPVMNGFEVCEYIRKHNAEIPVIVLSGLGTIDQAMQAIQLGAWDFLTKPIKDFELLEHSINKAFEKAKLLRENREYKEHLETTIVKKTTELNVEKDIRKVTEQKFLNLFENVNDSVYLVFNNVFVDCNKKALEHLKIERMDLMGRSVWDFIPEEQPHGDISNSFSHCIDEALLGNSQKLELVTLDDEGNEYYSEISLSSLTQDSDNFLLIISRDMTARKKFENELKKLSMVVKQSPSMVVITNVDNQIEYVNPAFTEVTGYSAEEVIGKTPDILKSGKMGELVYKELWETVAKGLTWNGELNNRKKNGELYWEYSFISPIKDDQGNIAHYVSVKEDITIRKAYEEKLLQQANYDDLTGLPNRILAMDRLSQAIDHAKRTNARMFLMLVDIDHFKKINDTLGHIVGDKLLKLAGERLSSCVRKYDTVARFGGDEFIIIIPDATSLKNNIVDKILTTFGEPFDIDGNELYITVSIGISISPDDGSDPYIMLRNADSAMYRAKSEGRNRSWYYSSEMNEIAKKRLNIENGLRHSLINNEIYLNFQPKISLATGEMTGAETLMRWKSNTLGFVSPGDFIPVAEDVGLIIELSHFMMREACKQAVLWKEIKGEFVDLAVNVSSRQFKDNDFIEKLDNIFDETGFDPHHFEIEITEGLLVENVVETVDILNKLHEKGIKVSIDDFGTGFSSLSYLKKFPVDKLKIDRSFINHVDTDLEDSELVKAIVAMGSSLGMEVIAEGVETEAQLDFLKSVNCDTIQGYYFSRPLSDEDFIDFIQNWGKQV